MIQNGIGDPPPLAQELAGRPHLISPAQGLLKMPITAVPAGLGLLNGIEPIGDALRHGTRTPTEGHHIVTTGHQATSQMAELAGKILMDQQDTHRFRA